MKNIIVSSAKPNIGFFFTLLFLCLWPRTSWSLVSGKEKIKTEYYMIGHAHIDPVWRWTKDEGYAEVFATFRSVLDRMKEYPDVAMVASSAQFYEWVAQSDPAMFAEIQQRVREGRWNLVSGWWVEADVNCPSGESLVRQGLYGQTFFQKHFGRIATVGFGPDTFGHPWTLPQILMSQGLDCYFYMRPELREKTDLTTPIFNWQGQDGSQLLTFAILHSYSGGENDFEKRCKQYDERFLSSMPEANKFAVFYGMGNHGGGPTIAAIEKIKSLQQKEYPGMRFSGLENYVQDIRKQNLSLTLVDGELQHHARGCYSACLDVKLWNRKTEAALMTAEKIASLNTYLLHTPYPGDALTSAWKRVLFNQFHDILAGSSIEQAYGDSRNDFGYSQSIAMEVLTASLKTLAQKVSTLDPNHAKTSPFIVFNPCSWPQQIPVEMEMQRLDRKVPPLLRDSEGRSVAYQQVATAGVRVNSRIRFVFQADLPALGYQIYRMDFSGLESPAFRSGAVISANCMENEWVRVTFDTLSGTIVSYYDKKANRELLARPAAAGIVLNDWDDTWGHRIISYDQEIGRFSGATIRILEQGPERVCLSVKNRFGASTLTQEFILNGHSPELSCRVALDWQEKARVFKLSFPTVLPDGKLTYSIPYGHIERPMNGEEEPGQNWLDVSGHDAKGDFGVALINDFACGYSVNKGDMAITVLHSTAWSHHNPEVVALSDNVRWMEQGIHEFNYLFAPHAGDWREDGIAQRAQSYLEPPRVLLTTNHAGDWPAKKTLLSFLLQGAGVTSAKISEDQTALIVRCVELTGAATLGKLLLESPNLSFPVNLRPAEIKTIRIPLQTGEPVRQVNLLEH
jgi:alpha-mannosidase